MRKSDPKNATAQNNLLHGALTNLSRIDPVPSADEAVQAGNGEGLVRIVIETPRGSRVKYKFDEDLRAFCLKTVLPASMVFPYNFGFIPRTLGGDGDPLDVLLLMEESLFPGCVLSVRLIGIVEVEQFVEGQTQRNDRLLAMAATADLYSQLQTLDDLPDHLLSQIEEFFTQYHRLGGKSSRTLARKGPAEAHALVTAARQRAEEQTL